MKTERMVSEDIDPPGMGACLAQLEKKTKDASTSYASRTTANSSKGKSFRRLVHVSRFQVGPKAKEFRKRLFPETTDVEWNDWRWQFRNRIQDSVGLQFILELSKPENMAIANYDGSLPLAITPYYASLLDSKDPEHPIRRTVVPVIQECFRSPGESPDPLGEEDDSPVPGLVHRYPDRVLFIATNQCSTYCRYCTRSRMVGKNGKCSNRQEQWERAIEYIEATPAIRDVLISGGDPLTLSDSKLDWLLGRLRRIPHVEILRIGSKAPVVLPQRITPALTRILKQYHPVWMSLHFTHPDELTCEVSEACGRLADAGIPLGSQTVLLSGINDDPDTMRRLFHGLMLMRVRPYYLYQCDPILGSAHFRTPVSKGLEIIEGLRGHTSGYALPQYVIDAPGGGGKIPLLPETVVGRRGNNLLLRNYEGKLFRYPDKPKHATAKCP